ncbi:MAG TPA: hypothetical protein ENJ19_09755 [Gammaproteobacteria bacterium]|nr:hypothetical protein [Gammaproteobacteria bacterium]
MQPALLIAYPLFVHLGVALDVPALHVLAMICLAAGLLYTGLAARHRDAWGILAGVSLLAAGVGYADFSLYVLYLPPILIPLLFFAVFLRSLLPGQVPLITAIADQARGPLSDAMRRSTDASTAMWTVLFAAMTLCSAVLPWLASAATWSFVTNFLNYAVVALVFFGEFAYRLWRFPEHNHPSFWEYILIAVRANIGKS